MSTIYETKSVRGQWHTYIGMYLGALFAYFRDHYGGLNAFSHDLEVLSAHHFTRYSRTSALATIQTGLRT